MAKPLQVYLDEGELKRLEAWSRDRGWTKSRAVRVAIRALTSPAPREPLLELSGFIDGLPEDCSERFDEYVNQTFVAERPTPYRRTRSRAQSRLRR